MREPMIAVQAAMSAVFGAALIIFAVMKIRESAEKFSESLGRIQSEKEAEYGKLASSEAAVYDKQLKLKQRLSELTGLYEITKEMSASLRFADIFRILAEYLHKAFLFKEVRFMLIKEGAGASTGMVYEAAGVEDSGLKARGIFHKVVVASRAAGAHERKVYEFLKKGAKRIEIVKAGCQENPYTEFLPENARSYMAVPIIIDGRLWGVLGIIDLAASDMDKFSILASQFTLVMRRIVLYEKVEEMAITDGLTKAFAKRHIEERLREEFERSAKHNFNLSFLMLDIDHFKRYNDNYGHLVGDIVLRDIVALLKKNTREVDLVGRFGGEEFCAILPETNKKEAVLAARRIRDVVKEHAFAAYDELTKVTVSIGVASYPDDAGTCRELAENADKALYAAKNSGRDKVCVYS